MAHLLPNKIKGTALTPMPVNMHSLKITLPEETLGRQRAISPDEKIYVISLLFLSYCIELGTGGFLRSLIVKGVQI